MRQRVVVIAIAAVVLITGGLWARAQVLPANPTQPTIFSGGDVGFRVDRWEGDTPIGRWVVRRDGKWLEPKTSVGTHRVTSQ
jgi:hypothetical protein